LHTAKLKESIARECRYSNGKVKSDRLLGLIADMWSCEIEEEHSKRNVIQGIMTLPFTSLPLFPERHSPAEDTGPRGCNFTVFL
jgi:hypothetical protein